MAKQSGLGDRLFVNGVDLSGDIGSLGSIGGAKGVMDSTGINSSAKESLLLRGDGTLGFSAYFNDAAGASHPTFKALPTTDVGFLYCRGTTRDNPAAALTAKQSNYDPSLSGDGALTFAISAQASAAAPLEWGSQITAGQETHASAGSSTGVVHAAQTAAGCVCFLQFYERASGTPTFTLQDSSDSTNGTDGSWSALGTFSTTGGASSFAERLEITGVVEKAIRVTTTGSFSNADFVIAVRRGTTNDDQDLS